MSWHDQLNFGQALGVPGCVRTRLSTRVSRSGCFCSSSWTPQELFMKKAVQTREIHNVVLVNSDIGSIQQPEAWSERTRRVRT